MADCLIDARFVLITPHEEADPVFDRRISASFWTLHICLADILIAGIFILSQAISRQEFYTICLSLYFFKDKLHKCG